MTNSAISSWETGRDVPSFAVLPRLRAALNVSLDELICGDREAAYAVRAAMSIMEGKPMPYGESMIEKQLRARIRELGARKQRALLEILKPEA